MECVIKYLFMYDMLRYGLKPSKTYIQYKI